MEKEIKVAGVTKRPHIQTYLRHIKEGKDEIIQVYHEDTTVIIDTANLRYVELGQMRQQDAEFLDAHHNTPLTPVVTGGELLLLDKNGKTIGEIPNHDALSAQQRLLILQGEARTFRKHFGFIIKLDA